MSYQYVTTGDVITTETGFLRGHGTQLSDDQKELLATVSGFVEKVNKLISVRPLNSRYTGEVGDVIVCRVLEVADKVWRVDVNSRQHGVLMLSAVNLPGQQVQRRRTDADALQMRSFFKEDDLLSAEVQKVQHDGSISLHTRNEKYGKLVNGQCLQVPALLVKRCKQHFHSLPCGVDVILGNNGFIWMQASSEKKDESVSINSSGAANSTTTVEPLSREQREKVARVRNCVAALAQMHIAIYMETVMDVYAESLNLGLPAKDILNPNVLARVTQVALSRTANTR